MNSLFFPGIQLKNMRIHVLELHTLIAADAVVFENGKLAIANPDFTLDLKSAVASIRKLQQFQIEKIICYHGGIVIGNIKERLHQLALEYAHLS
jgi:glyoxylase-like metal-dependent hydrolase (beta-lactamase superfamily II)